MPKCLPENRLLKVFEIILMSFLLCVRVSASNLFVPFIGAGLPKWPELGKKIARNDLAKRYFFYVLHFGPILNMLKYCISQFLCSLFRAVLSKWYCSPFVPRCLLIWTKGMSEPMHFPGPIFILFPLNCAHWTFPLRNFSEIYLA